MIVERVGLPGVGKSHLSRRVESALSTKALRLPVTIAIEQPASWGSWLRLCLVKCAKALRFAAGNPATARRLQRHVRLGSPARSDRLIRKTINLLSELDRAERHDPSTLYIVEQGVLQAIWSLSMLNRESIHQALLHETHGWLPDGVVVLEAPLARVARQLERRRFGRSQFDRLRGEPLCEAMHRGHEELHDIVTDWKAVAVRPRLLDIRNDAGACEHLLRWVRREYESGHRRVGAD